VVTQIEHQAFGASVVSHLRRTELRVLLVVLAVFGLIWLFLGLTGEVREGETGAFDRTVLLAFRRPDALGTPIGPRWLMETARDITALGGFTVLTLVVGVAFALLLMHRRRLQALIFALAVAVGQCLAWLIKLIVARPRPDLVPHLDLAYSSSFPSGHSAMSPIVYMTLAAIVAAGDPVRAVKALLLGGAVLLALAIGVSRVYLGVHWPTDVLAGWTLGAATALCATLVLHATAPHRRSSASVAPG
jgi:undecaprenyl-diphosphatase